MSKKIFTAISAVLLLTLATLVACGESSTTPSDKENSSSSSEETISSSSEGVESSLTLSSDGEISSEEGSLSSEKQLEKCVVFCEIGTVYKVGDRCSRGFRNWIATSENSVLPSEDTMNVWADDGECNK